LHRQQLNIIYDEIVNNSIVCAENSIPISNNIKKRVTPGWNEFVKQYRDTALFWHSIWKSCDSPTVGNIACIRRRTRAEYHSAIKQVKNNEKTVSANRLAEAFF
jgi:hypothetical protein